MERFLVVCSPDLRPELRFSRVFVADRPSEAVRQACVLLDREPEGYYVVSVEVAP